MLLAHTLLAVLYAGVLLHDEKTENFLWWGGSQRGAEFYIFQKTTGDTFSLSGVQLSER